MYEPTVNHAPVNWKLIFQVPQRKQRQVSQTLSRESGYSLIVRRDALIILYDGMVSSGAWARLSSNLVIEHIFLIIACNTQDCTC